MPFVLLALSLYIVGVCAVQQVRLYQINRKIALVKQEIGAARLENEQLKARAAQLGTDEYVERVAREKLGLIKPGEIPYVAVPSAAGPENSAPAPD